MPKFGPVGEKSLFVLKNSTATIECYEGAVRSGKTITSLLDFMKFLIHGAPGEVAMVGRTERTVYRNLIVPLQHMLGINRVRYNQGNGILTLLGRNVYVIGANNEESVAKIQGMTLAALYIDEATVIPQSFFNMSTTRLSVEGAKMWITCNPAGRNHWLKKDWIDKASLWIDRFGDLHLNDSNLDMRLHRYTFTIHDNPHLNEEFVKRLQASYTGVWYQRYILSQWTNAEGAVFDMWDPDRHVIPDELLPQMDRVFAVGIDYGTTNATSAIKLGQSGDVLYLLDEWRHDARAGEPSWTDLQLSQGIRQFAAKDHEPEWFIVDPSAASFKLQLHNDGVKRIMDADNSVIDGIRTMASLLKADKLKVGSKCTGFIGEAPEYAWDPKATEKGEDKPLKENDHSLDAGRYALHSTRNLWRHIAREALGEEHR